jgi:hypothetical protein
MFMTMNLLLWGEHPCAPVFFVTVDYCGFEMHIGRREVGQLASQKIVIFCETWQSTQIQLKSCCWMEKLSSVMDCSRLCTAAAGHRDIVASVSAASDWQFCALHQDNISTSSDNVVCTHVPQKSCVVHSILCTDESRPTRGQREWNLPLTLFLGCTTTLRRR